MKTATLITLLLPAAILAPVSLPAAPAVEAAFADSVQPLFAEYCNKCHSTEKHKGDLDLERFHSFEEIRQEPEIWEKVRDQIADGEMPPKDKPPLSPEQKTVIMGWIAGALDAIGRENAGDPGPVVMRRLSNAEYGWTLRDLTGVPGLDPGREFPVDGAAGEGFTNAGAALVMSPSLLTKYLDAAKEVAAHAVLLPGRIAFSGKTTQRDWTEEKLAAIRDFYAGFTASEGATQVNLQGVQFETNGGGRLPLEKYLHTLLTAREAIASGAQSPGAAATAAGLSPKYAGILWDALNGSNPNTFLNAIRHLWRNARPENAPALAGAIAQWQKALWRFATVGHIGKKDGPAAWQLPVTPLVSRQDIRLKLPPPQDGSGVTLYLAVSDAGDGSENDAAVWENPRLVAPGRPDLPLRDVRRTARALAALRETVTGTAAQCLAAAAGVMDSPDPVDPAALAQKHGLDPAILGAWLNYLGIGAGSVEITTHLTQKADRALTYDFIKGWTGADALSVMANSSDGAVKIPGTVRPHSVVVHPSPSQRVAVGWRSPVSGAMTVSGRVQHSHHDCGNGVTWSLERRRGHTRERLAAGISERNEVVFGPFRNVLIRPGDLLSLVIGPRDGNHSCDLTALDLTVTPEAPGSEFSWDLAKELSPGILEANPHADRFRHEGVWHFYSEPAAGAPNTEVIPADSLVAKWLAAPAEEKPVLAGQIQALLRGPEASGEAPDAVLRRQLVSLQGPLLSPARQSLVLPADAAEGPGPDPALFDGSAGLPVRAPGVLAVTIPAELAEGAEFVTTAALKDTAGSVQMQVLTAKPAAPPGLTAGGASSGAKTAWSDGETPLYFDSPILVADQSEARTRLTADMEEFRNLFPAALCYTKIVPVDEVVTLTLFFREDGHLQRLILDDAQRARLEQLWDDLHFVSQDALTLVDAYEQLWQFATQDADPGAFTPMREPIMQRAAAFRKALVDAEPGHLQSALEFARRAWRRPLSDAEQNGLRGLYTRLRAQELPHDAAVRMVLVRVLTAPAFLYRGEKAAEGAASAPVSDRELAVRLSYFLWSSTPDAELAALADSGTLHEPAVLTAQVRRMLRHPSVRRMASEFGCQWLHVRDVDTLDEKSERHFPEFTALRGAMKEEPVRFFTDLFQNDGSVLSLLDADHTFVNGALAGFYSITGVEGDGWQRVAGIQAKGRGGVLGFAATLAKHSGASRTSAILRGNWFCETLLGERLPRPPKGVPVLPEETPRGLTERQLIEKHSNHVNCAGCHARIDPFGYALEGFDAIGKLRTADAAGLPVNTAVTLPNGTGFDGLDGLRRYLLGPRRGDFLRQVCRKLLGYALGRSVMLSDKPLIDEMIAHMEANGYRISQAVELIVNSRQFREVRGRGH